MYFAPAVVLALLATGCVEKPKLVTSTEVGIVQETIKVKTETTVETQISEVADFTANLEANFKTFICPSFGARIDKIYVDVGDRVKKGQLLVAMDRNQFAQTSVQLANLESDLARMQAVYEAGGASKQSIDQLETQIRVMRESIDNLKKNTELRSPVDGVVTGRYNEQGDLFMLGANRDGGVGILQVMQINPLKAEVAISEKYFTQVTKGMPVEITTDIYPDKTFSGRVSLIYPAINPSTRTFTVEVTVPNNYTTLRPGMFARTAFNMGIRQGVSVSDMAIQRQSGTNDRYVYVIKDGKAEKRKVTIGRQNGDRIEILSGLNPGEQVAVAGLSKLNDGSLVEIEK